MWKADSGDALGEGKRRLGARDELCADHGKSVYAGNGTGGDETPGTASFSVGGAGRSPAAMTGEEKGLGVEVPVRGERPWESMSGGASKSDVPRLCERAGL